MIAMLAVHERRRLKLGKQVGLTAIIPTETTITPNGGLGFDQSS
jgi:hypothetical protein